MALGRVVRPTKKVVIVIVGSEAVSKYLYNREEQLLRCAPVTGPKQKVKIPSPRKFINAADHVIASGEASTAVNPVAAAPRLKTRRKVPATVSWLLVC